MSKRFTEGIAFDGTAILDNVKPITITEILNNLNNFDDLEKSKQLPKNIITEKEYKDLLKVLYPKRK
jgi:hypothetical protein